MALDIRTVLRNLDDLRNSQKFDRAYQDGFDALKTFDQERDYKNSIQLLQKLQVVAEEEQNPRLLYKILTHLQLRHIISGSLNAAQKIENEFSVSNQNPLSSLLDGLFLQKKSKPPFLLHSIERQTIFGDFETLSSTPHFGFDEQDQIIRIIEDFLTEGRYSIHVIDTTTSLIQTINFDFGLSENVNIVENETIVKLDQS